MNRLVVGDASWADMIPKWVLDKVAEERVFLGLAAILKPDIEQVGDAEVVAYLMPASMRAPMYYEYVNIYLHLAGKLVLGSGRELPEELMEHVDRGLGPDEERTLKELRQQIYRSRGGDIDHPLLNALRDFKKSASRRAAQLERHEERIREQEEKTGQPALFG